MSNRKGRKPATTRQQGKARKDARKGKGVSDQQLAGVSGGCVTKGDDPSSLTVQTTSRKVVVVR